MRRYYSFLNQFYPPPLPRRRISLYRLAHSDNKYYYTEGIVFINQTRSKRLPKSANYFIEFFMLVQPKQNVLFSWGWPGHTCVQRTATAQTALLLVLPCEKPGNLPVSPTKAHEWALVTALLSGGKHIIFPQHLLHTVLSVVR